MVGNYVNRLGGVCGTGTDPSTLPEAELWTQVILQAINDLGGRRALAPQSAQDSARQWFASECDGVCSFVWACQIINVDPNFIRSQLTKKLRMKNPVQIMGSRAERAKPLRRKDSPVSDNLNRAPGRSPFKRLAI
jgi:hypothetical protein